MTARATECRGRSNPVRPLSIDMLAGESGTASDGSEREQRQDHKKMKKQEEGTGQLLKDQRLNDEEEYELFGPSSEGRVVMNMKKVRKLAGCPVRNNRRKRRFSSTNSHTSHFDRGAPTA